MSRDVRGTVSRDVRGTVSRDRLRETLIMSEKSIEEKFKRRC